MDDVRYIILPGELRNDERLTLSHFKVAMVLGAYSKRQGWTDLTQNDVGEMAGLSRETVCRCVGDLSDWGWVAKRKKPKKNQYVYRFIMDREEHCDLAITEPKKDCEPAVTGTVISDITSNKEKSSSLSQSNLSAPLPPQQAEAPPSGQIDESIWKGVQRTSIRIRPGDVGWSPWMEHLAARYGERHVERMVAAGEIHATTRWPAEGTPYPRIGKVTA